MWLQSIQRVNIACNNEKKSRLFLIAVKLLSRPSWVIVCIKQIKSFSPYYFFDVHVVVDVVGMSFLVPPPHFEIEETPSSIRYSVSASQQKNRESSSFFIFEKQRKHFFHNPFYNWNLIYENVKSSGVGRNDLCGILKYPRKNQKRLYSSR